MKVLGLIVEYNPFHNGHMYHLQEAKKKVQPDVTIVVMSGHFVQRGEPAITDKWTRCQIAIENGVDLVIELPFVYAVQSADYFAKGAISLLHAIGVTDIVFGSEDGNIDTFMDIAKTLKENDEEYNMYVKDYMQQGYRYPDACNQALSRLLNKTITTPNDLLGLAYVKEVVNQEYPITLHCITRTNDFHGTELHKISSATALRKALLEKQDISNFLPSASLYQDIVFMESLFPYLKYKILTTSKEELASLHLVEEGLENLLLKQITNATSMQDFVTSLTSKRYTRSRIQRMLLHILMNNTKAEIQAAMEVDYLRILGMNSTGQHYLHHIKKKVSFQIVANYGSYLHPALTLELKATRLYSCLHPHLATLATKEYKQSPLRITD